MQLKTNNIGKTFVLRNVDFDSVCAVHALLENELVSLHL